MSIGMFDSLTWNWDNSSGGHPTHTSSNDKLKQNLLVLSREWMGMGEWGSGIIIDSYCGSFPRSLLSTSKVFSTDKAEWMTWRLNLSPSGCRIKTLDTQLPLDNLYHTGLHPYLKMIILSWSRARNIVNGHFRYLNCHLKGPEISFDMGAWKLQISEVEHANWTSSGSPWGLEPWRMPTTLRLDAPSS